jgi:hypothetical protein
MSKKNPLKLLEKGKRYRVDSGPLNEATILRLARQRYLIKQFGVDKETRNEIPMYSLSYRGDIFKGKPVLDEWKYNEDEVAREIDGIEATSLLYGNPNK